MVLTKRDIEQKSTAQEKTVIKGGGLISKGSDIASENGSASYDTLQNVSKASLTRISVSQLPREIPNFQLPGATKDSLITEWLTKWIAGSLASGELSENHLLPRKEDIAKYLGVSVGTVQNAIRFVEDEGHVESKQRIGTLIRDASNDAHRMRKQTSKRDQAVIAVKQFIIDKGLEPGNTLPSTRQIASAIGSAPNTTRLALEFLATQDILESRGTRGNKAHWELKIVPEIDETEAVNAIESETLIDQLERDLKNLIAGKFEINEKLPSHLEMADLFKVSIKTVHDAMKRLADQGIVCSKRGRYGTYVLRKPDTSKFFDASEGAGIFLPVQDASFYNYEKVEQHLKQFIKTNFKVGDKLPSMGKLSEDLDVSSNTIRKALQNLAKQGVVTFTRGRYGGTFVTELPEVEDSKSFTWVSINPETIKTYRNTKVGS